MTSNPKLHRRGLKEAFRTILPRRRDDRDSCSRRQTKSITLLRTKDPSLTLLPTISSLSSLPDFESSAFDLQRYDEVVSNQQHPDLNPELNPTRVWPANVSQDTIIPYVPPPSNLTQRDIADAYQYQSDLGRLAQTCSVESEWPSRRSAQEPAAGQLAYLSSQESLFSRWSSSQIVTPASIHFQSPLTQLAHACNVPSMYQRGTSLQASLTTLRSSVTPSMASSMRSASTLRLQRSVPDLPIITNVAPVLKTKRTISIGSAKPTTVLNLDEEIPPEARTVPASPVLLASSTKNTPLPPTYVVEPSYQVEQDAELDSHISSINHFSSFCVLDAAARSCPVTATSQDLRLVFEIGEDFCLDTVGIDGASMDTITGQDTDGNVVVHLIIYNQLVNPNSGRSRFVLATLLDITSFITGTASLPDLETISEESVAEEEINTPPRLSVHRSPRYQLPTENFADDYHVSDRLPQTPLRPKQSDIWLDIASEETRRTRSVRSSPSTPRSRSSGTMRSTKSMEDILDQFLASLQSLYSDFFLLGKSPLDENTYEICNVSPRLFNSREYIEGHLSRTSSEDKACLEQRLTQEESFRMKVKWGLAGDDKQLYCIPLFGRSNITWACFLVEEDKPPGIQMWD